MQTKQNYIYIRIYIYILMIKLYIYNNLWKTHRLTHHQFNSSTEPTLHPQSCPSLGPTVRSPKVPSASSRNLCVVSDDNADWRVEYVDKLIASFKSTYICDDVHGRKPNILGSFMWGLMKLFKYWITFRSNYRVTITSSHHLAPWCIDDFPPIHSTNGVSQNKHHSREKMTNNTRMKNCWWRVNIGTSPNTYYKHFGQCWTQDPWGFTDCYPELTHSPGNGYKPI